MSETVTLDDILKRIEDANEEIRKHDPGFKALDDKLELEVAEAGSEMELMERLDKASQEMESMLRELDSSLDRAEHYKARAEELKLLIGESLQRKRETITELRKVREKLYGSSTDDIDRLYGDYPPGGSENV